MGAAGKSERIRDALLAEIGRGAYDRRPQLPSENDLVARFGVARETVRKAIADLERRGLVRRKQGTGTFVSRRDLRRSGLIGLLIPDASSARIFRDFAGKIEALAARNGYEVVVREVVAATEEAAKVRIRRIARELVVRNVDGVVFRPLIDEKLAASNREVVRIFRNAKTPVVLLDSDVAAPPDRSECDLVAIDNVSAGRRVAEHLLRRGKRKVAFLMNGAVLQHNVNWRNRFFGVAGEMAMRNVEEAVRPLDFRPDDLPRLRRLYRSKFKPDAIVCGNDETAVLLAETLLAIGKRIPEDVAVVGFDDTDVAAAFRIPLTTVHQPTGLIARAALRALVARMARPGDNPREIYLSAPLVIRKST